MKLNEIPNDTLAAMFFSHLLTTEDYRRDWIERAVLKFQKGRKEHNDDLMQLDCDKEIEQEKMDIEAYKFIKKLQKWN